MQQALTPSLVTIEIYRPETRDLVVIARSCDMPRKNDTCVVKQEAGNGKNIMVGCRSETKQVWKMETIRP